MELKWVRSLLLAGAVLMAACFLPGCASNTPPPDRSPQEIKSDSDRSFEKMKQEERARGKGPEGTTR
jgi:hypothetical protein